MIATDRFIVFNAPDLGKQEEKAVSDVLRSGWVGTGKISHQFEEEFADFMGGGYAVAVSSCSMGLQLSLIASGIKHGKIITTPLTFAATVNSIVHAGLMPIFIDVDDAGCINLEKAKTEINSSVFGMIPVHYSGNTCDLGNVSRGTIVIEDCAHAFGSYLKRDGLCQVFSFYANKNITCGEGGMVLTKDKDFADEVRTLSSQGLDRGAWERYGSNLPRNYAVSKQGFKGNLPDVLAAIGLAQLKRWPEMRQKRLKVWRIYQDSFGAMPHTHSTHFYPLRIGNRDDVRLKLFHAGIGTGIHYKPLHLEPAYKSLGYKEGDFPVAEAWGREEISLPVSSTMTENDAWRVVEAIKGEFNK